MKFICDEMLGTLAKWLRIMGYDTAYAKGMKDEEIILKAEKEERIVLTRDKMLARKAKNSLYIDERKLEEQIKKVMENFDLDFIGAEFFQSLAKGLQGALDIGPQQNPQLLELTFVEFFEKIVQGNFRGAAQFAFPLFDLAAGADAFGHFIIGHNHKFVPGLGNTA